MEVNSQALSEIKTFFSRLNTNNDGCITNDDEIDARIKEALGIKENSGAIIIGDITEENFDKYNELYQKATNKLVELQNAGEKPKMGLEDMQSIDATDPKTEITTPNGKKVLAKDLVKEFGQIIQSGKKDFEIQQYFRNTYGFEKVRVGNEPRGGKFIDIQEKSNQKGLYYCITEDFNLGLGTQNMKFYMGACDNVENPDWNYYKQQNAYYTHEGQFIKHITD